MFQYQVQERAFHNSKTWYPHPNRIIEDDVEAMETLREMKDHYSPYGRQFRLVRREVTEWEVIV